MVPLPPNKKAASSPPLLPCYTNTTLHLPSPCDMQTESKPGPLMAPTSSTDHSGELDRHQPLAAAAAVVMKRKRTKRPRHHLPATSSASSSESTTTEEEDMANCLILLAQGGGAGAVDSKPSPNQPSPLATVAPPPPEMKTERYTSRKYTEAATTADGVRAGFYVYECRTCNKCFPTFQALGGHRASHKKTRLGPGDEEIASAITKQPPMASPPLALPPPPRPDVAVFPPDVTTTLSLSSSSHHQHVVAAGSSKQRVHECSICGAEFSSGQALGGHMRRHRPLNAPPERAVTTTAAMDGTSTMKKEGSASINLELDLNLPAPSTDEEAASLPAVVLGLGQFNDGKKAGLMLTASALVDCHY